MPDRALELADERDRLRRLARRWWPLRRWLTARADALETQRLELLLKRYRVGKAPIWMAPFNEIARSIEPRERRSR
jgi:hypothetical protein